MVEEVSIPDPTALQAAATATGAETLWSNTIGDINTVDAHAEVRVIEVASGTGERVRGVAIALRHAAAEDHVYVPAALIAQVRQELQHLEFTKQFDRECETRCTHGIARCRPSQSEPQAFCPARYRTGGPDRGFLLSTPRNAFSFPGEEASRLDALLADAAEILNELTE
ncbi:MAG: hypothetical protein AAGA23_11660 [Pseudomonadota bacterium]